MSFPNSKSNPNNPFKTILYKLLVYHVTKAISKANQLDFPDISNVLNEYCNAIIPFFPIRMCKRSGILYVKNNRLYYTISFILKIIYVSMSMLPMYRFINISHIYMLLLNSIIVIISLMSILMDWVLHHCCYDLVSVRNWLNLHDKHWFKTCQSGKKQ